MPPKEPQYEMLLDLLKEQGRSTFGLMANDSWNNEPKRTLFTLSRYKFVAKMLEGKRHVLEVGCADAFATRIVRQAVDAVTFASFDLIFINDVKSRNTEKWHMDASVHDMVRDGPFGGGSFDRLFAIDVLEHML